jgi:ligand-binding SRPBCC domain-containing protein
MQQLRFQTDINVDPDLFWKRQSIATISQEMGPWLRMTAPPHYRQIQLLDWRGDNTLFASWVLLFGLIPIDRHSFEKIVFPAEREFIETSSSWNNKHWQHRRLVTATENGCSVIDELIFTPRMHWMTPLVTLIVNMVFKNRHRNLKKFYPVR